jgi:hypothetical protein
MFSREQDTIFPIKNSILQHKKSLFRQNQRKTGISNRIQASSTKAILSQEIALFFPTFLINHQISAIF